MLLAATTAAAMDEAALFCRGEIFA